jgi:hypothetical protein
VQPANRALVRSTDSPTEALDVIAAVGPAPAERWITPDER